MHKTYSTKRLNLKPTSKEDAPFILELFNTPKWKLFIGDRNLHSVSDAEAYIQNKMTPQLERLGFSNYTLIRKSDGVKVGTCGLYDRDGLDGIDIGFALLPAYERQGYTFEAATKLLEIAFNDFGYEKVSGITVKENIASQRLLEKLGLKQIGTTRIPNDSVELLLYQGKTNHQNT